MSTGMGHYKPYNCLCWVRIASCTGPAFAFAVSYREKLKGMRMGGSKKRVDAQFSKSRDFIMHRTD